MERKPNSLEITTALYLGKIVSYQEEIIKMLSEIATNNTDVLANDAYIKHINNAKSRVPDMVNDFLNKYRVEADHNHPQ